MKRYPRFITLTGGILAFLGFSLPWDSRNLGVELASNGINPITVTFFALLGIVIINLYLWKSSRTWKTWVRIMALIAGNYGIFYFLVLFLQFANSAESLDNGSSFVTIAFIASLVSIGMSLMLNRKSLPRTLVLISSGIGLCCFLILFFGLRLDFPSLLVNNLRFGAFLTTTGFILAIAGVLETPKTTDSSESGDAQKGTANL